jgi:two-component system OmpR family response regulator
VLGEVGYDVRCAADTPSALDVLREWLPDTVLLDIELPGADGWACRRAQRACPGVAALPAAILLGKPPCYRPDPSLVPAAIITTPFDLDQLLAVVGRLARPNRTGRGLDLTAGPVTDC